MSSTVERSSNMSNMMRKFRVSLKVKCKSRARRNFNKILRPRKFIKPQQKKVKRRMSTEDGENQCKQVVNPTKETKPKVLPEETENEYLIGDTFMKEMTIETDEERKHGELTESSEEVRIFNIEEISVGDYVEEDEPNPPFFMNNFSMSEYDEEKDYFSEGDSFEEEEEEYMSSDKDLDDSDIDSDDTLDLLEDEEMLNFNGEEFTVEETVSDEFNDYNKHSTRSTNMIMNDTLHRGDHRSKSQDEENQNLVFSDVDEEVDILMQDESDEDNDEDYHDDELRVMMSGMIQEDLELQQHIRDHGLNLVPSQPTRNDGNCWYDAIADQILLHDLPNKPTNHLDLRAAVCSALPSLPQAGEWVTNIFGGWDMFEEFLAEHRKPGVWTDPLGIMCQATALYVGRDIHIVGTANIGQMGPGFTKLESVPGAGSLPALTVGYLQDRHYQSLVEEDDTETDTDREDFEESEEEEDEIVAIRKMTEKTIFFNSIDKRQSRNLVNRLT